MCMKFTLNLRKEIGSVSIRNYRIWPLNTVGSHLFLHTHEHSVLKIRPQNCYFLYIYCFLRTMDYT